MTGYLIWEKLATSSQLREILMQTRSATSDYTRYLQISSLILLIINIPFWSKFWNIKRVSGYLFCTERNDTCIIISSIICRVRWYQIFPDITLNLVSYLYLLIINIRFLSKSWHIKRVAGYINLHRKKCYTHNYIKHHLPRQMILDISSYHA